MVTGGVNQIMALVLGTLLLAVFGTLSQIFLGLCIYNDAKYYQDDNPALWGLLSGFFWIAAIVYLVIRSTKKQRQFMRCVQCGEFIAPGGLYCPRCGRMLSIPSPEGLESYNRKRRLFFGLWIGSIAVALIASVLFFGIFIEQMIALA